MLQRLKNLFKPRIGVTKRNFLMISADIKKGIVIVSYKGKVKYGKFSDNTLRNMVNDVRFEKSAGEFLAGTGKLINQVIK
jgi:hypothetical protein